MLRRYLPTKVGTLILSLILLGLLALNTVVLAANNTLENKAAEYHLDINEIVNQHVYGLISFFDEKTDLESISAEDLNLLVAPPENDLEVKCFTETEEGFTNLSSTCLHYKLLTRYNEYSDYLDSQADGFNVDIDDVTTHTELLALSGTQQSFISSQKQEANDLIEQTIKFVNQIYFSYPIHKQYELTIEELDEFKSNLKLLRNKLKRYPSKFHNATSTECT